MYVIITNDPFVNSWHNSIFKNTLLLQYYYFISLNHFECQIKVDILVFQQMDNKLRLASTFGFTPIKTCYFITSRQKCIVVFVGLALL